MKTLTAITALILIISMPRTVQTGGITIIETDPPFFCERVPCKIPPYLKHPNGERVVSQKYLTIKQKGDEKWQF